MQQALHAWICGFSAILLCRTSQALSGWMGTISGQSFQVSPQTFDWVQVHSFTELSLSKGRATFLTSATLLKLTCLNNTWGLEGSGLGFHQGYICIFLNSGLHVSCMEEWLQRPKSLECCSDGRPSTNFSHLHTWFHKLNQSDHQDLHWLLHFLPALGRVPAFFHLLIMEATWKTLMQRNLFTAFQLIFVVSYIDKRERIYLK